MNLRVKGSQRVRRLAVAFGGAAFALVVGIGLSSGAFAQEEESSSESGEAKNVIFMMGDGMAQAERDAIQLATVGAYDRLVMDSLPVEGSVGTNSVDEETFVTDSAAGATSFASGVKTLNGAVGVDADGNIVPTVLEQAKAAGKSVGIVTTSQVTDASPAAFASHVEDRDEQTEIARQYIEEARVDVILGGGEDRWLPEGEEGAYPDKNDEEDEEVSESDQGNLVEQAEELGYEYVTDADELASSTSPKLLGLFANEEMFQQFPEPEGVYDPEVPLPDMTQKAIDVLSQDPDGFFLFVEEEAIDEMGHANNGGLLIESGQALDEAVSVAKDYTDASGDTLLIVTADHECCGVTIESLDDPEYPDENGGNEEDENANVSTEDGPFDVAGSDYQFIMDYTTTSHTGVDVPLTASGPGSEELTGNYENTAVYDVMVDSLGVAGLSPDSADATEMPDTGGLPLGAAAVLTNLPVASSSWAVAGGGALVLLLVAGGLFVEVRSSRRNK